MSELTKLLEGVKVEWLALSDITSFTNGKGHEKVISDNGKFIVVNSKFVSTEGKIVKYSNDQICPLYVDDILIVMSDLPNGRALAKTYLVEADNKYTLNQRIGRITVKNKNQIVPRYLNYLLNRTPQLLIYNNGIDQTNLKKAEIQGTSIPIPCPDNSKKSLKIQEEIVRILDRLSEETNQLTAALQKELNLHQKQYDFYREELFKFEGKEVEWRAIDDYIAYLQPTKYLVKSKNYSNDFETPVLTAGKTFILGYTDEIDGIYKAKIKPVIIFDDFTTANKWVDFDFKAKSSAMKILVAKDDNKISLKYFFYILKTIPSDLVDGDHKRQWISNYANKLIPIPCPDNPEKSLKIQEQIVGILDRLSEETNQLTKALQKEISLRNKLYEFYRDRLLSFPK